MQNLKSWRYNKESGRCSEKEGKLKSLSYSSRLQREIQKEINPKNPWLSPVARRTTHCNAVPRILKKSMFLGYIEEISAAVPKHANLSLLSLWKPRSWHIKRRNFGGSWGNYWRPKREIEIEKLWRIPLVIKWRIEEFEDWRCSYLEFQFLLLIPFFS